MSKENISIDEYFASIRESIVQRTLCLLMQEDKILLGRRKRGLSEAKFVGIGGRVEPSGHLSRHLP